jgi:hypothetical protein
MFSDVNYIFVIILSPISSSHATYDENGHFVMEYVPFCDQSLQRHEKIVTDKHFSSSEYVIAILLCANLSLKKDSTSSL